MFLVYEKNTFGGELELKENELSGVRGLLEKTERKLASVKAIVSKKNLDKCFNVTKISEQLDVSEWESVEGFGFAMKLPLGFHLEELETKDNALASYVVARKDGVLSAEIGVWDMRGGYIAKLPDAPSLFYEFLSDTWWQYPNEDVFTSSPSGASECLPNELAKKEDLPHLLYAYAYNLDGVEITAKEAGTVSAGSAEPEAEDVEVDTEKNVDLTAKAGAEEETKAEESVEEAVMEEAEAEKDPFQKIYFVLMRDVKDKTHAPLIISFSIGGDKNSPEFEGYEDFREILETVIRTLEARPIK